MHYNNFIFDTYSVSLELIIISYNTYNLFNTFVRETPKKVFDRHKKKDSFRTVSRLFKIFNSVYRRLDINFSLVDVDRHTSRRINVRPVALFITEEFSRT